MSETETPSLARTMGLLGNIGMEPHEVTAASAATVGLSALAGTNAPIPLEVLDEWQRYLNQIRTSRRPPLPPTDKGLRVYEDGMPG